MCFNTDGPWHCHHCTSPLRNPQKPLHHHAEKMSQHALKECYVVWRYPAHVSSIVQDMLHVLEVPDHPPYSLEHSLCALHVFISLRKEVRGLRFCVRWSCQDWQCSGSSTNPGSSLWNEPIKLCVSRVHASAPLQTTLLHPQFPDVSHEQIRCIEARMSPSSCEYCETQFMTLCAWCS